jgi:hypothetical protein
VYSWPESLFAMNFSVMVELINFLCRTLKVSHAMIDVAKQKGRSNGVAL